MPTLARRAGLQPGAWLLRGVGLAVALGLPVTAVAADPGPCTAQRSYTLVMHGGAGSGDFPAEVRAKKRATLSAALRVGQAILARGGRAEDAVVAAIAHLEDSGDFNAGKGAITNRAGFVELDASLMTGRDKKAGAVAAVRTIKNPIRAAQAVMRRSEHVLFVDRGAEAFARAQGLAFVESSYFLAPRRAKTKSKSGTVGAVAVDRCGHLAGGTSTGGYTAKAPGRVGDSPLIGAGTYADNDSCAVSATGWGEYFIRWAAAYDVAALVAYKGLTVEQAARTVLAKIEAEGATGGLIVLDRRGRMALPFTSKGMMRGYVDHRGEVWVGTFAKLTKVGSKPGR